VIAGRLRLLRKIMKKLILALSLFSAVTAAGPNDVWHTSNIKQLYPLSSGDFIIRFTTDSDECAREDKYHYVLVGENQVTAEGSNNMLSVALTAATLGKEISINFDKTSPSCAINRLNLNF